MEALFPVIQILQTAPLEFNKMKKLKIFKSLVIVINSQTLNHVKEF